MSEKEKRPTVISETYRKLNSDLHEHRSYPFGGGGRKWGDAVAGLCIIANSRHFFEQYKIETVLDYGCGPSVLTEIVEERLHAAGSPVRGFKYDPCVKSLSAEPSPADLVVCTDVLEHIEPDLLDNVLQHLDRLAKKALFLVISLQESQDVLPNGEPAHQIIKPYGWWMERLTGVEGWNVITIPARKPQKILVCLILKKEFDVWAEAVKQMMETR